MGSASAFPRTDPRSQALQAQPIEELRSVTSSCRDSTEFTDWPIAPNPTNLVQIEASYHARAIHQPDPHLTVGPRQITSAFPSHIHLLHSRRAMRLLHEDRRT